jgi:ribosomal protein S18 acetylase RimI-like enzyme
LADLFASSEAVASVGLENDVEQIRSRLQHPGLDLDRYTLIGIDRGGRVAAYAEVCDMGVAADALRIRLTGVIQPDLPEDVGAHLHGWLMERADRLRRERAPQRDAMLGTRCADPDRARIRLLTDAGFDLAWRKLDMTRDLHTPVPAAPAPPGLVLTRFDARYDEPTRLAHNDAYAGSQSAALPDPRSWPRHATGQSSFLPEASFLALTPDNDVAAFVLTLGRTDEARRPVAVLECLGTRPTWRRRGLASALITRALGECGAKAFPNVRLQVDSTNTPAIELYAKLQFTDTGHGYSVLTRRIAAGPGAA